MFDIGGALKKLLGRDQPQMSLPRRPVSRPQQSIPAASQSQAPRGPLRTDAGYHPMQGGVLINQGTTEPGFNVEEDNVQFPNGGSFNRLPGGQAQVTGGWMPSGGYAEDDFRFPQTSVQDRLRRIIGR